MTEEHKCVALGFNQKFEFKKKETVTNTGQICSVEKATVIPAEKIE